MYTAVARQDWFLRFRDGVGVTGRRGATGRDIDADGNEFTGVIILYGVSSFGNLIANCKSSSLILDAGVWNPFSVGLGRGA